MCVLRCQGSSRRSRAEGGHATFTAWCGGPCNAIVAGPRFRSELAFEKYRLFRKCSSSRVRSVSIVTQAGALIGRDSELAMLNALVTEAAAGRGSSVLIEGEPGVGKSSLVRSAV